MLFHAKIDETVLKDENALCEQLYLFLKSYIPRRLVYEDREEREDCTQETIMYLLDRYHKLTEQEKTSINIEKFFYNRARSYVSLYVRGLKKRIDLKQKYREHELFLKSIKDGTEKVYVDLELIREILKEYVLSPERLNLMERMVHNRLVSLGYRDSYRMITMDEVEKHDPNEILITLSVAATDEYLLRAVEDRGGRYK